jgi:hypothetical protein
MSQDQAENNKYRETLSSETHNPKSFEAQVYARFDAIDSRFDLVERRIEAIDRGLERLGLTQEFGTDFPRPDKLFRKVAGEGHSRRRKQCILWTEIMRRPLIIQPHRATVT